MHRTFSIVIDIQLNTEKEEEVFNAVIHSSTMELIQNTLENAIEIRDPMLDEVMIKLWDSEKITEQIEALPITQTKKEQNETNLFDLTTKVEKITHNFPASFSNPIKDTLLPNLNLKKNSKNITKPTSIENDVLLGSEDTLRCLTKHEAQKMCVFPLQIDEKTFICATTTQDSALINKLRLRTGKKIVCVASPLRVILNSIEKAYHKSIDTEDRDALLSSLTK